MMTKIEELERRYDMLAAHAAVMQRKYEDLEAGVRDLAEEFRTLPEYHPLLLADEAAVKLVSLLENDNVS